MGDSMDIPRSRSLLVDEGHYAAGWRDDSAGNPTPDARDQEVRSFNPDTMSDLIFSMKVPDSRSAIRTRLAYLHSINTFFQNPRQRPDLSVPLVIPPEIVEEARQLESGTGGTDFFGISIHTSTGNTDSSASGDAGIPGQQTCRGISDDRTTHDTSDLQAETGASPDIVQLGVVQQNVQLCLAGRTKPNYTLLRRGSGISCFDTQTNEVLWKYAPCTETYGFPLEVVDFGMDIIEVEDGIMEGYRVSAEVDLGTEMFVVLSLRDAYESEYVEVLHVYTIYSGWKIAVLFKQELSLSDGCNAAYAGMVQGADQDSVRVCARAHIARVALSGGRAVTVDWKARRIAGVRNV
ncbi:hypothetical protein DFH11DRAFT_1547637 [Phellopilus nigrolimitatus]|nr:hypothetical protein DFH11DRAFT_1547637 [Phellopilus nigrolimitatus]